jgi:hypothetical protein
MPGTRQSAHGPAGAKLHVVGVSSEGKYVERLGHRRWANRNL